MTKLFKFNGRTCLRNEIWYRQIENGTNLGINIIVSNLMLSFNVLLLLKNGSHNELLILKYIYQSFK